MYGWQAGDMHPTVMLSCYRPQTKIGKVMFSQLFVCLQEGVSVSVQGGIHPRGFSVQGDLYPGEGGPCLGEGGSVQVFSVQGVSVQGFSVCVWGGSLSRGLCP